MRGRKSEPRPVLPSVPAQPFDEGRPCQILRHLSGQRGFFWCWVHDQTLFDCIAQREALAK